MKFACVEVRSERSIRARIMTHLISRRSLKRTTYLFHLHATGGSRIHTPIGTCLANMRVYQFLHCCNTSLYQLNFTWDKDAAGLEPSRQMTSFFKTDKSTVQPYIQSCSKFLRCTIYCSSCTNATELEGPYANLYTTQISQNVTIISFVCLLHANISVKRQNMRSLPHATPASSVKN